MHLGQTMEVSLNPAFDKGSISAAAGLNCMKMFSIYSSSTNGSLPSQPYSLSLYIHHHLCFDSITAVYMYTSYGLAYFILLVPLSTVILHLGYQRWKQPHSSTTFMSHSDFFTYNMAAVDLIGVLGAFITTCGSFGNLREVTAVGVLIGSFPWSARMLFPVLICLERYCAVVHPITYLALRQTGGIRMRNISTVLVWLQCCSGPSIIAASKRFPHLSLIPSFIIVLCLSTATFCSLSILCVLMRPRPGKAAGDRVQADQSKRKAFKIVVMIMGVLLCKFAGQLVFFVMHPLPATSRHVQCAVTASTVWFNLPSSLVLPLPFLYKEGKIKGCKRGTESG